MTRNLGRRSVTMILGAGALGIGFFFLFARAGNMEPPAAPASTMMRTIRAADLPLMITTSGLWVLEDDIDAAGAGGITITVPNVTLDLRGHSLRNGTGDGIAAAAGSGAVEVKNGTVSGWTGDGVDLQFTALGSVVRDIRALGNGNDGILVTLGTSILDCVARGNGQCGIQMSGAACTISRCTVTGNTQGICSTFSGHVVADSTASFNSGTGINITGSTVVNCTANENASSGISAGSGSQVSHCTAFSNGDAAGEVGILANAGSSVTDCTASSNAGDGIQLNADDYAARNTCDSNGTVDGAGIHATNSDNRIEDNNVTDNDRGIDVDLAGNTIFKNSASGNTVNFDIVAGNDVGPIGTAAAAASPWANIAF